MADKTKRKPRQPPTPEKALQLLMQSIAAQQNPGDKSTDDKKPERKPRPAQYTVFRAVVQTDRPHQMDVFRWLISDSAYSVCWILHDRDKYAPEDCEGVDPITHERFHLRKGWDNVQRFTVGQTKPAHIHMIVKTGRKCTGETMSERFGHYVTFEGVTDVQATALYLTHRTYAARNKYQYPEMCVQGDLDLYANLAGLGQDEMHLCRRWLEYMRQARDVERDGYGQTGDFYSMAIKLAIAAGDKALVKSVMSHGYFYKNLL